MPAGLVPHRQLAGLPAEPAAHSRAAGTGPTSLAARNLLRGQQVGLPSGQDVARAMGIRPLRDDQILIGKATGDPADAEPITADLPGASPASAPLWTYVLAEATATRLPRCAAASIAGQQVAPFRLGPVGGRIVAETFAGPPPGGPRLGAPQRGLPAQRVDRPGRQVRLQGPDRRHDLQRARTGSAGDDPRRRERGRRRTHRAQRAAPSGPAPLGRELVALDRARPASEAPRERGFRRARVPAGARSCRARPGSWGAAARAAAARRPSARTGVPRPAHPSGDRARRRW